MHLTVACSYLPGHRRSTIRAVTEPMIEVRKLRGLNGGLKQRNRGLYGRSPELWEASFGRGVQAMTNSCRARPTDVATAATVSARSRASGDRDAVLVVNGEGFARLLA